MIFTVYSTVVTPIKTTTITAIKATEIATFDTMANYPACLVTIISFTTATVATACTPATKDSASTTAAMYPTSPSLLIVAHFVPPNVITAADDTTILPIHLVATHATTAASDAYPTTASLLYAIYLAAAQGSIAANGSTTTTHPFINISLKAAKATTTSDIKNTSTACLFTFIHHIYPGASTTTVTSSCICFKHTPDQHHDTEDFPSSVMSGHHACFFHDTNIIHINT
jgi:hypothetical protein